MLKTSELASDRGIKRTLYNYAAYVCLLSKGLLQFRFYCKPKLKKKISRLLYSHNIRIISIPIFSVLLTASYSSGRKGFS